MKMEKDRIKELLMAFQNYSFVVTTYKFTMHDYLHTVKREKIYNVNSDMVSMNPIAESSDLP